MERVRGSHPIVLVLLHGRGSDRSSMEALAERLGLEGVRCVAPAAPGGSWYPQRFAVPRADNEPDLSRALAAVDDVLDDLELEGVAPARIVLGGFSQGACLAVDALARRPRRLGGVAILSGGLIGADEDELILPPADSLVGVPVLITVTERDAWVPVERVRRSAEALQAAGAEVDLRVFPPGPHGVRPEEVDALRELVLRRLPGGAAGATRS
jgi:predicted esterase